MNPEIGAAMAGCLFVLTMAVGAFSFAMVAWRLLEKL
jgi:hypothetical protein